MVVLVFMASGQGAFASPSRKTACSTERKRRVHHHAPASGWTVAEIAEAAAGTWEGELRESVWVNGSRHDWVSIGPAIRVTPAENRPPRPAVAGLGVESPRGRTAQERGASAFSALTRHDHESILTTRFEPSHQTPRDVDNHATVHRDICDCGGWTDVTGVWHVRIAAAGQPTIDAVFEAMEIHAHGPDPRYLEYWDDPIDVREPSVSRGATIQAGFDASGGTWDRVDVERRRDHLMVADDEWWLGVGRPCPGDDPRSWLPGLVLSRGAEGTYQWSKTSEVTS